MLVSLHGGMQEDIFSPAIDLYWVTACDRRSHIYNPTSNQQRIKFVRLSYRENVKQN